MSETDADLMSCLDEAEIALDARDHCRVDLRACESRLAVRTPTTAAVVLVAPPEPAPGPGFDAPLVVSLVVAGLALGAVLGFGAGVALFR